MLRLLRLFTGRIILVLDSMFRPTPRPRSQEDQTRVDALTKSFALYQFESCPFCVKVRRAIRRENLNIELRDAANNEQFKAELIEGGGEYQVPCLRIQHPDGTIKWMYESSDIIAFLETL